ncbi:hypothetical protein [Rhodococcus sp. BE178]|uniref:hypothetical protein n=1 Tax=Rhodococcus sp. BE178 TaxID=2817737 RepID=UPI003D1FF85D
MSATVLAPILGSRAAIADPIAGPAPTTTVFQIPVTFLSGCRVGFRCWIPPVVPLAPTATTGAPGEVTFQLARPATYAIDLYDCIGVSVNWKNLTTGATGTAEVRRVPIDYSRPIPQEDLCRYVPATVVTGSGTVVATAASYQTGDHVPVGSGVALFEVP